MGLGCSVCGRNDKYVREGSLCILHCDKEGWKKEGHWKVENVTAFWKELRQSKKQDKQGVYDFRYISFPPFQAKKAKKTHAIHADFTQSIATEDFSFWNKGETLAFAGGVDFSFARFHEGILFEDVYIGSFRMQKARLPYMNFNNVKLERIHLKALSCNTIHFQNVSGKSFLFDHSRVQKMELFESELERVQLHESHLVNVEVKAFANRRFNVNKSQLKQFNVSQSVLDVITLKNSQLQRTDLNANKLVSIAIEDAKLYTFILGESRITSVKVSDSQCYKSFQASKIQIDKLQLLKTRFSQESTMQIQNGRIKNMTLEAVQLHRVDWETLSVMQNVKMSEVTAHTSIFKACDFKSASLDFKAIQLNIQDAQSLQLGKVSSSRIRSDASSSKEWAHYYKKICRPLEWQQFLKLYERKKKDEHINYQERFKAVVEIHVDHVIRYEVKSFLRKLKSIIFEKQICLTGRCA